MVGWSRHPAEVGVQQSSVLSNPNHVDPIALHCGSLFLGRLPKPDLRRIVPHLRIKEFAGEEVIHHDSDMIRSIVFPHDAVISLVSLLSDGTTVEGSTVGSEGYVGVEVMLGSAVATCCAVAQHGRASAIALDRLLILVDQMPSLRAAMLAYARNHLAMITRLAACNALHTLKQRACRRLLLVMHQTEQRPLTITQEELARALGVGRTSVNQACKELRRDNIIDYSRGHIRITDFHAMTQEACECYSYLRHVLSV
jgi:CRP-like cAMP-binding protein